MITAAADPEGFYSHSTCVCVWVAAVEGMQATKGQFFGLEAYPIECFPLPAATPVLYPMWSVSQPWAEPLQCLGPLISDPNREIVNDRQWFCIGILYPQ